jgi:uncharacterized cupredoxin-like copper-binding protein
MTTDDATPTEGEGDGAAATTAVLPIPEDESHGDMSAPVSKKHPYRERYLLPFIFPLIIVIGVVFYVLNVSRLFLATKGTAALLIASAITVLILVAGAALSSAEKMKTTSIAMITIGGIFAILVGGTIVVGHADQKKQVTITLGPPVGSMTITVPNNQLTFEPKTFQVPLDPANPYTSIQVNYHDGGNIEHTLAFDDPTVVWTVITIKSANQVVTANAGFPKAGTYTFFCTIPGHRTAGMQGTVTVTPTLKPQKVSGGATTPST